MKGDLQPQQQQQQQQQQQAVADYDDDFESQYRQQAASSGFRGHSPIREVKFKKSKILWVFNILKKKLKKSFLCQSLR